MLLRFLSLPSLSPQLFREPVHQSVDERKLQHISCVCADIFLRQPECDLSALPGSDLCRDRIRHLCACEYIPFKNNGINQRDSKKIVLNCGEEGIFSFVIFAFVFFLAGLSTKNRSVFHHTRKWFWFCWTSDEVR